MNSWRGAVFVLCACFLLYTYAEQGTVRSTSFADVFDKLDSNKDGVIDQDEFAVGTDNGLISVITKKAGHAVAFITSFINSAIMTMVTEIGDKTFCIAAIMAMRSNRWAVFIGCVGALLIMTFLSVVIGVAVPTIFSPEYTHYISILLFVYFGIDMLREGAKMDGHAPNDELAEAEEELAERGVTNTPKERVTEVTTEEDVSEVHETAQLLTISTPTNKCVTRATVAGGPDLSPAASDASEIVINVPVVDDDDDIDPGKKLRSKSGNFFTNLWREKAVLTQAFTIIFFAEWGDKSQIATIAMASSQNPWGVGIGGFIGHSLCTVIAVVGGRLLASRISEKTMTMLGGTLFLIFALHSYFFGKSSSDVITE